MTPRTRAADLSEQAADEYYKWIERVIALATGALTLSVTFREKLLGEEPRALWLMDAAWVGLASTVLCGLIVTWGKQATTYKQAANHINVPGQLPGVVGPPWYCGLAMRIVWLAFFGAVFAFTTFAIINNRPPTIKPNPIPLGISPQFR